MMMRSGVGLIGAAKHEFVDSDCISRNLFLASFSRALLMESFLLDNDELSVI